MGSPADSFVSNVSDGSSGTATYAQHYFAVLLVFLGRQISVWRLLSSSLARRSDDLVVPEPWSLSKPRGHKVGCVARACLENRPAAKMLDEACANAIVTSLFSSFVIKIFLQSHGQKARGMRTVMNLDFIAKMRGGGLYSLCRIPCEEIREAGDPRTFCREANAVPAAD